MRALNKKNFVLQSFKTQKNLPIRIFYPLDCENFCGFNIPIADAMRFQQTVCGFDILRADGVSFVCDVNGWSFIKGSKVRYTSHVIPCTSHVTHVKHDTRHTRHTPHVTSSVVPYFCLEISLLDACCRKYCIQQDARHCHR